MQVTSGMAAAITGAASGIGAALAAALAVRGVRLALADVDRDELTARAAELTRQGAEVMTSVVDVADADQVIGWAAQVFERFTTVDIVINNAGIVPPQRPTWEVPGTDWERVLDINLGGVINGIRAFVPRMVECGHGCVVNTASMAGVSTVPFIGPYTASKFGIVGISEALAEELRQRAPGLSVAVLCPGYIPTRLGQPRNGTANQSHAQSQARPPAPGGLTAHDVAEAAIAAIETGIQHIVPSPGSGERIEARAALVREEVQRQGGALPLDRR